MHSRKTHVIRGDATGSRARAADCPVAAGACSPVLVIGSAVARPTAGTRRHGGWSRCQHRDGGRLLGQEGLYDDAGPGRAGSAAPSQSTPRHWRRPPTAAATTSINWAGYVSTRQPGDVHSHRFGFRDAAAVDPAVAAKIPFPAFWVGPRLRAGRPTLTDRQPRRTAPPSTAAYQGCLDVPRTPRVLQQPVVPGDAMRRLRGANRPAALHLDADGHHPELDAYERTIPTNTAQLGLAN